VRTDAWRFGVSDWTDCARFPDWCVGHRAGVDADADGHQGPVAVIGSFEDGDVTLSAELKDGWLSFNLDVGEWEAHGPSVAEDFDALARVVAEARAAALDLAAQVTA
jgi:hypothetical protein